MVEINTLKKAVLIPLNILLQLTDYVGLDKYSQQALNRRFPYYVAEFEKRYGPFGEHPQLAFEPLFKAEGKVSGDYRISLNKDPQFVTTILHRESTIKHELGHLVVNEIARGVKPTWFYLENGRPMLTRDMFPQIDTIHEGCADYLSVQNGGEVGNLYRFNFVRPILDELGVQDGIKKLLLDPPTQQELKDPESYYRRLSFNQKQQQILLN